MTATATANGVRGMRAGLAAVAVVAAIALTGCGKDDPAPAPVAPAKPTTAAAEPSPEVTSEDLTREKAAPKRTESVQRKPVMSFAEAVGQRAPEITVDRREEEIQAIADEACGDLQDGDDADTVVARTRTLGAADKPTARDLVQLAIETTCPDQKRRIGDL